MLLSELLYRYLIPDLHVVRLVLRTQTRNGAGNDVSRVERVLRLCLRENGRFRTNHEGLNVVLFNLLQVVYDLRYVSHARVWLSVRMRKRHGEHVKPFSLVIHRFNQPDPLFRLVPAHLHIVRFPGDNVRHGIQSLFISRFHAVHAIALHQNTLQGLLREWPKMFSHVPSNASSDIPSRLTNLNPGPKISI